MRRLPDAVLAWALLAGVLSLDGREGEQAGDPQHPAAAKLAAWRARERARGIDIDDNDDLPHHNRIALLMTGLTQPVTQLALASVQREIRQPLGENNVHIFVHTSSVDKSGRVCGHCAHDDVAEMFIAAFGEGLRTLVVDQEFRTAERVYTGKHEEPRCTVQHTGTGNSDLECVPSSWPGDEVPVPRMWHPPKSRGYRKQFDRLSGLFPHVLAEEKLLGARYSHLVRLRTDSIWFKPWTFRFVGEIDPSSRTVALPHGTSPGVGFTPDNFWLSSRGGARAAFVGFADFLLQPIDRKAIFDFFNCSWPSGSAGGIRGESDQNDTNSADCRSQILAGATRDIWPETMARFYFRSRFEVKDSCDIVGPYVSVQGWNKGQLDVARQCAGRTWAGITSKLLSYQISCLPSLQKRFPGDVYQQRLARDLQAMLNDPNPDVAARLLDEAARLNVDVSELDLSRALA